MSVVIETTKGDITVDLYVKERPQSCKNFLKLCKIKYYNFCLFHHVQHGFIAQTGDPTGTGRGGDSISGVLYGDQARLMKAELVPRIKHSKIGTVSLVNHGDNMIGSQFFITLAEDLNYLDDEHCVIGEVVEGFETLETLNETICDNENRPYQDIRITHTVIIEDPFDDPAGLEVPDKSPKPTREILDSGRIGADEDINDMQGKTAQEIEEMIAEKEAKARATILEMVGDLPDADMAPPENVLFVCKLNPVTTDDDLEIIFSRFGRIKSCEVIRDQKSKESLQYAFVEFEDTKACEDAYFKMDNVLIDDRRIHVDFSQSVSKYKWKGKGRGVVVDEGPEKKAEPRMKAPWIIQSSKSNDYASRSAKPRPEEPPRRKRRDSRSRTRSRSPKRSKHKSRDDRRRRSRSRSRSPRNSRHHNKNWSRSPPRYSRGYASEQSKEKRRYRDRYR